MATQRRIEANRRNAQKSTGPRTPEGKARSSRNAAKEKCLPRRMMVIGEDAYAYDTLLSSLEKTLNPHGPLEQALVRQIADAEWRLNRAANFETGLLSARFDTARRFQNVPLDKALETSEWTRLFGGALIRDAGDDTLSKLSRYEMRLSRRYFTALERLEALQDRRTASNRPLARKSTKKKITKRSQ